MSALNYAKSPTTDEGVERSINAITTAINDITISEAQSQENIAVGSSSGHTDVDSVLAELSSLYSNLLTPNAFTVAKLIEDLSNKRKRYALIRFLFDDARLKLEGAKSFFTRLSEEQYNVLIQILNESSLPRFWRYLKICADIELGQCRHLPTKTGHAPALIVRIHNLPNILFDAAQETVVPRVLMSSMQRLKGLPVDLLEPIQRGMVWVVDDGPPAVSTDLIYRMPTLQIWNILAVQLRFTLNDLSVEGGPLTAGVVTRADQGLDEAMGRLSMNGNLVTELVKVWQAKYDQIAVLRLESLIVDMTEAYSPDGAFLGVDVARSLPRFIHGCPRNIMVLAPTEDWKDEIYSILA